MANEIFRSWMKYTGEDIHILRGSGAFDLTQYFNTTDYEFEFIPQLRGSKVAMSDQGTTITAPIPNASIQLLPTTPHYNGTGSQISVSVYNVNINTSTGLITAAAGGTPIYNVVVEVRAYPKDTSLLPLRTFIRVHFHNKITNFYLTPATISIPRGFVRTKDSKSYGDVRFSVHALFDDNVYGDITLMPYVSWSVPVSEGTGAGSISISNEPDTRGFIVVPKTATITKKTDVIQCTIDKAYCSITGTQLALVGNNYQATGTVDVKKEWDLGNSPGAGALQVTQVGPTQSPAIHSLNVMVLFDGFSSGPLAAGDVNLDQLVADDYAMSFAHHIRNDPSAIRPWNEISGRVKIWQMPVSADSERMGTVLTECVPTINMPAASKDAVQINQYIELANMFLRNPQKGNGYVQKSFGISTNTARTAKISGTEWLMEEMIFCVGLPVLDQVIVKANVSVSVMAMAMLGYWKEVYDKDLKYEAVSGVPSTKSPKFIYTDMYDFWARLAYRFLPVHMNTQFALAMGTRPSALHTIPGSMASYTYGKIGRYDDVVPDSWRMTHGKVAYLLARLKAVAGSAAPEVTPNPWYAYDNGGKLRGSSQIAEFFPSAGRVIYLSALPSSLAHAYHISQGGPLFGNYNANDSDVLANGYCVLPFFRSYESTASSTNNKPFELLHFDVSDDRHHLHINPADFSAFSATATKPVIFDTLHELTHTINDISDEYGDTAVLNEPLLVRNAPNVVPRKLLLDSNGKLNSKKLKWRWHRLSKVAALTEGIDLNGYNTSEDLKNLNSTTFTVVDINGFSVDDIVYLRMSHDGWNKVEVTYTNLVRQNGTILHWEPQPFITATSDSLDLLSRGLSNPCKIDNIDRQAKRITISAVGMTNDSPPKCKPIFHPHDRVFEDFKAFSLLVQLVPEEPKNYPASMTGKGVVFSEMTARPILEMMNGTYDQEYISPSATQRKGAGQALVDILDPTVYPNPGAAPSSVDPADKQNSINMLHSQVQNVVSMRFVTQSGSDIPYTLLDHVDVNKIYKIVGLYNDGAEYYGYGIYHPTGKCYMRVDFKGGGLLTDNEICCPICSYILTNAIYPEKHPEIDAFYQPNYPVVK